MADDRSFIAKPPRGWLHSDQLITKDGINYDVEYIGCVEVLTSMKSLDFETRSQVAKECIWRACEESGTRWRRIVSSSSNSSNMSAALGAAGGATRNGGTASGHNGVPARLTVSSRGLRLCARNGSLLAQHDMPRISFASGGDSDTTDFVAYVAKNLQNWRACYVLHCAQYAQELIATIGQAFELRFKEFLTKPQDVARVLGGGAVMDQDYYNDMPNKVPPELMGILSPEEEEEGCLLPRHSVHHYVNQELPPPTPLTATLPPPTPVAAAPVAATTSAAPETDAFDMRPFAGDEDSVSLWEGDTCKADEGLSLEPWYHASLGRADAEKLLSRDGDFLVRLSRGGQLVLSGARGSRRHHLLLVDPAGHVRTRDRSFRSVPHLVRYHAENRLPILSADSALMLLNPVNRKEAPTATELTSS